MLNQAGEAARLCKVGRRRASTFSGFCSHHDSTLFGAVDFREAKRPEELSEEQQALLALRATAHELFQKRNVAALYRKILSFIGSGDALGLAQLLGLSTAEVAETMKAKQLFRGHLYWTKASGDEIQKIYDQLIGQIRTSNYRRFDSVQLSFSGTPTLAAAGLITPEFDVGGARQTSLDEQKPIRMSYTIIPDEDRAIVCCAAVKQHALRIATFWEQLRALAADEAGRFLTHYTIANTENAAFSPDAIDAMPKETRDNIEDLFGRTIRESEPFDGTWPYNLLVK